MMGSIDLNSKPGTIDMGGGEYPHGLSDIFDKISCAEYIIKLGKHNMALLALQSSGSVLPEKASDVKGLLVVNEKSKIELEKLLTSGMEKTTVYQF